MLARPLAFRVVIAALSAAPLLSACGSTAEDPEAGGGTPLGGGGARRDGGEPGSGFDAGRPDDAAPEATPASDAGAEAAAQPDAGLDATPTLDAGADGTAPLDAGPDAKPADGGSDAGGADPCVAQHGDGHYCGGSLPGTSADPDTLYHCVGKKTADATACANGCTIQPPGVPDACAPGPGGMLGKGIWVWMFNSSAPSAATVAQRCQDLGIGFVLVKSGEDTSAYTTNFSASNVAEFTSRGIEVYGWPYVRPGNIAAKVAAAVKSMNVPGVTGLVLDVEGEWESTTGAHDADAIALCDGIRAGAPGKFLGYTTFGWVGYHTDFPFAQFDQHCGDAFLPQTYWDEWSTGPVGGLNKAVQGAATLGLSAPIWAIQDNYGGATVADMNTFFDAAGARSSLWRYPNPSDTSLLAALGQLHWTN